MRNTKAGEKAAERRGGATNSTLAGINLLVPRPLRRTKQAR
jgi:hypothetical protein